MIYVSTSCLKGAKSKFTRDVFKVLDSYKKIGIENIELGSVHKPPFDLNKLVKYKKETNANFIVHGFFPPSNNPFMLNLGSKNKVFLNKSMEFIKNSIGACSKIDAGIYSFHGGFTAQIDGEDRIIGPVNSYEESFQILAETLNKIADFAAEHSVKIAVENAGYESQSGLIRTKEQIERLFKAVNNKNVGLLLDIGHLNYGSKIMGFDKKAFVEATQKYILEIHAHQNNREGDQHLNVADVGLFKDFNKKILKRCALTLEANNLSLDEIKKGTEVLKKVIG